MEFNPSAFLSGFGGAVIGSGLVVLFFRYLMSRVRDLETIVGQLRDTRLVAVETRMEKMEAACVGPRIAQQMTTAVAQLDKIDQKLERISDETAQQRAEIAADHAWIGDLSREYRAHAGDRSIHQEAARHG